ncbi:MAG: hypothetical protein AAF755_05460 [Pseudomonadota bacterium]
MTDASLLGSEGRGLDLLCRLRRWIGQLVCCFGVAILSVPPVSAQGGRPEPARFLFSQFENRCAGPALKGAGLQMDGMDMIAEDALMPIVPLRGSVLLDKRTASVLFDFSHSPEQAQHGVACAAATWVNSATLVFKEFRNRDRYQQVEFEIDHLPIPEEGGLFAFQLRTAADAPTVVIYAPLPECDGILVKYAAEREGCPIVLLLTRETR